MVKKKYSKLDSIMKQELEIDKKMSQSFIGRVKEKIGTMIKNNSNLEEVMKKEMEINQKISEEFNQENNEKIMKQELEIDKKMSQPLILKVKEKIKNKIIKPKTKEDIVWDDSLSVGEETIDKQHKQLFDQINLLRREVTGQDKLKKVRDTLTFLDKYVKEHFTYEEAYMKKIGFPGLKKHEKTHVEFMKFYTKFKKDFQMKLYKKMEVGESMEQRLSYLSNQCYIFLSKWLKEHIAGSDQEYAKFARKKGLTKKIKPVEQPKKKSKGFDIASIKKEVERELKGNISKEREMALKDKGSKKANGFIQTGIPGFDELFQDGVPKGASVIVAGGAGSGKTISCLQLLNYHASHGNKCFYMSFEESEKKLVKHMEDFGWDPKKLIKKGKLKIKRYSPFDITRSVEAMLAKEKGELLIDLEPVILPKGFKPDVLVLDSLTAIASAFTGKEDSYRIYIEQLFRFFENMETTAFLITETEQIPKIFSTTGVEEFLADGVIVFYNFKRGDVRENAIEVLKMRGAKHQKKIVAMQITGEGIIVYPDQEVFAEMD